MIALTLVFVAVVVALGYFIAGKQGLLISIAISLLGIVFENIVNRLRIKRTNVILAMFVGVGIGWLFYAIYKILFTGYEKFVALFFLTVTPYVLVATALRVPEYFDPVYWIESLKRKEGVGIKKILDTSAIIDGRIADICATGFLEGPIIVPQFILHELQKVADSSDTLKRQRGRRGLDILERLRNDPDIEVTISEIDFPEIRNVDQKLLELAKRLNAKIITNDFNLNKLARVQGLKVLNINELANALKPVVLPGETMRVFILKEGKERDQGVAYLDDGTMVVVDNARKMIGRTIEITVTSVLQTTAGKMIFGRYND